MISPAYNDTPAVNVYCPESADPKCTEKFRLMRIHGDGTAINPAIDNTPAESIVNRLVKLLQYLERREPQRKWGDYLENGAPKWDRIALAGQSQGAGYGRHHCPEARGGARHSVLQPLGLRGADGNVRRLATWLSAPSKTPAQRWYGGYHERENMAGLIARAYAAVRTPSRTRAWTNKNPAKERRDGA